MKLLKNLFSRKKNRLFQPLESRIPSKDEMSNEVQCVVDLSLFDYSTCWHQLCEAVKKKPERLRIDISHATDISCEFALMFHSLLSKHREIETQTHLWCSVRDAALLLPLSGQKRTVEWFTWTKLTKLEELRNFRPDPEEQTDLFAEPREISFATNYAAALQVINSYIPIQAIRNRRHSLPHLLAEYGLLSEPPVYPFPQSKAAFGR
jgi:hypothetical protein